MSINVTVTGNPVYLGRGKVLLTDIETAKKNEWLRRRKIRLQQARQQAKDLAQSVRKKVSCEESVIEKNEEEKKIEEQNKHRQEQINCLQNEYQKSLSSVGTGHHLACIQNECDALAREKKELRDVIAKARGAIAEERLKVEKCIQREKSQVPIGRKKMVRHIEDLRSALISNLSEVKSSVMQTKKSTTKAQVHHGEEQEDSVGCNKRIVSPIKRFAGGSREGDRPNTRSSLSPPRSVREPVACRPKKHDTDEEDSLGDEESDGSDVTWPPRSARVTKEPLLPNEPARVRFYDHNTRIVRSSPRPSYSITRVDPFEEPDMSEAIAEEEEAIVRKENLDILARREKMIRGNKALRKERGKREAEKILKELREMNRKEKIKIAVNRSYPSDIHMSDSRRKEMEMKRQAELTNFVSGGSAVKRPISESTNTNGIKIKTCDLNDAGVKVLSVAPESPLEVRFDSSTDNDDFFEELVHKLKVERAKKQQELEKKFGVDVVCEGDIPHWVKCQEFIQETAGPSGIKRMPATQDRAVSPVKCELISKFCPCNSKCTCNPFEVMNVPHQKEQEEPRNAVNECEQISEAVGGGKPEDNEPNRSISPETDKVQTTPEEIHVTEKQFIPPDVSLSSSSPRPSVGAEIEHGMVSSKSSSHSNSDTVESSLTFEGIKVTVKVSEKGRKKKDKLSGEVCPQTTDKDLQTCFKPSKESLTNRNMTWNNQLSSTEATSSGSTSYMSPPSKLSPDHQALLRAILSKIDAKNKNPRLHQYIKRVLEMSRKSIDDLPVSSVSDVSINSSIFDRSTRQSKRLKTLGEAQKVHKFNVSCQANGSWSDDSTTKEEALKFSELAESYAHRLQDLAGMMERMRILPDRRGGELTEDSSAYLSPPRELNHSVKLSQSVKVGIYPPKPTEDSIHHGTAYGSSLCQDLPPSHIYPHPSTAVHLHPPPSLSTHSRKQAGTGLVEAVAHELSTIQEGGESQRPETPPPNAFDPDISSIRGTPQQHERRESTSSSLCLLDDRDVSSWLGSSSDDYEEVFRSLGIAWALPTVRKTRQSQRRVNGSQSSSRSSRGQCSHSTPLGQSPARPHSISSVRNHQQPTVSADSDSLTPPSLSLNIPKSVCPKHRGSK